MKQLFSSFLIFVFDFAFISGQSNVQLDRFAVPCITPNQEAGLCTEIQKCPVLRTAYLDGTSNSFIRASRCGPKNEDVFQFRVCCGTKSDFNRKDTTERPEIPHCPKTSAEKTTSRSPLPKKCGSQILVDNRIIGGIEAELGEFPWMARLQYKNVYGNLRVGCAGFLIHKKYVLTAAHCIESKFAEVYGPLTQVQFGEHDDRTEIDCESTDFCAPAPIEIEVNSVMVHPSYNKSSRNHEHDIALLQLKKHVPFSDYVRPLCVLQNCMKSYELLLSGWGSTESSTSSHVKLKVSVPRVLNEKCNQTYANINKEITSNQMCAGTDGRDSCKGDSGGPLMVVGNKGKWYAEGIVSYGYGCGDKSFPGVYTYLPKYYDWIVDVISKKED